MVSTIVRGDGLYRPLSPATGGIRNFRLFAKLPCRIGVTNQKGCGFMTKTVALYARTGRYEEASGQAIDAQVTECIKVAKQLLGDDIKILICQDKGVSGTTSKPALQCLEHDISNGSFAAVVVTALNRLGCPTISTLDTVRRFRKCKVDFVGAQDGLSWKWNDVRADLECMLLEKQSRARSKRHAIRLERAKVSGIREVNLNSVWIILHEPRQYSNGSSTVGGAISASRPCLIYSFLISSEQHST